MDLQKEGFKIRCSQFIEKLNLPIGTDLADVYFDTKIQKNIEIKKSKAEISVIRLAKINPEILNLISSFDLVDDNYNDIVNVG